MRALTFIAPFGIAALTVKPYDNRKLVPPKSVIGQRIAIHAGAKYDEIDEWGLLHRVEAAWIGSGRAPDALRRENVVKSAIIGTTLLRGYLRRETSVSEWRGFGIEAGEVPQIIESGWVVETARVVLVFGDPVILGEPIPMRGAQGWWTVPEQYLPALEVPRG